MCEHEKTYSSKRQGVKLIGIYFLAHLMLSLTIHILSLTPALWRSKRINQADPWTCASQYLAWGCMLWRMTTTICSEPTKPTLASDATEEPLAVLAGRAAIALEQSIERLVLASDQNLGHLEVQVARDVQELLRQALQRGAQAKADATAPRCPVCGQPLSRVSGGHARTFQTRYGAITIQRTRGYCKRCHKWRVPADAALGLEETAGYSPAVQDMCYQRRCNLSNTAKMYVWRR